MNDLSLATPAYLVLLAILLPVAWWGLTRQERRRTEALATFGDPAVLKESSSIPASRGRLAGQVVRVACLALALLALARPQLGSRPAAMAQTGRDLLVLLDLSRSMNAADAGVSRLSVAKQAISQVLAATPGSRVGLIVFGGSAFLQLPLTTNHAAFRRFMDAATTDDLGDPATDLSSALATAATTFEHDGEPGYQSVLLVSDGESGEGDVSPPLTRLRGRGIPVFAIGIGTPEGAPVPSDSTEAPEQWHRDHIGRVVLSRLEEGDLRRAARETSGLYSRWTMQAARNLQTELARLEQRTIASREATERVDRFQWPLAGAMMLLVLEPILRAGARRRRP